MAKRSSVLPTKDGGKKRAWHWESSSFEERAPCMYEFLATALVDGEERKGGSVTLFCSNGALKVCYLDKQTQMAFYAVLEGTEDLLHALEEILAGEHEQWTPTKHNPGKVPF